MATTTNQPPKGATPVAAPPPTGGLTYYGYHIDPGQNITQLNPGVAQSIQQGLVDPYNLWTAPNGDLISSVAHSAPMAAPGVPGLVDTSGNRYDAPVYNDPNTGQPPAYVYNASQAAAAPSPVGGQPGGTTAASAAPPSDPSKPWYGQQGVTFAELGGQPVASPTLPPSPVMSPAATQAAQAGKSTLADMLTAQPQGLGLKSGPNAPTATPTPFQLDQVKYVFASHQVPLAYGAQQGETADQRQQRLAASLASGQLSLQQLDQSVQGLAQQYKLNPTAPYGGVAPTPTAAPGAAPTTPTPPNPTTANGDAFATLQNTLNQLGLGSLANWAWNEIVAGKSTNQIYLELRDQPAYQQRFGPAQNAIAKAGLPAMSEQDILNYEQGYRQIMRDAGAPPGFYDQPSDIAAQLGANKSLSEIQSLANTYVAEGLRLSNDPNAAQTLEGFQRYYGVKPTAFEVAAMAFDPTMTAPLLARRVAAVNTNATSTTAGFGPLSQQEAEHIGGDLGVSDAQAQQGFGQLTRSSELFNPLPGEAADTIDRAAQLGATFDGDANAQQRLERQARLRAAPFMSGGSYAPTKTGFGGLGAASNQT